MLEESLVQQPTATWNTARGVWEKPGMANLLCEHWALFSEAWPTSGMMRNGQVLELPMQERHTTDSESLSSPTLPTPNTMEHLPARTGEARERQLHRGGSNSRRSSSGNLREDILGLVNLPTPVASEGYKAPAQQDAETKGKTGQVWLSNEAKGLANKNNGWGRFESAILRWESTLGRKAPAPTKPDGKDDQHRLSAEFTEWMMGLEPGWITDCGLTRNEELKAAGNGVVPQQAELALRILMGFDIPKALERERELIPTPTVFHVSMHDEPIETFLTRQAKSSTGQIGKSLGVALRMELDK